MVRHAFLFLCFLFVFTTVKSQISFQITYTPAQLNANPVWNTTVSTAVMASGGYVTAFSVDAHPKVLMYLMRTDDYGNIVWTSQIDTFNQHFIKSVIQDKTGDIIISGTYDVYNRNYDTEAFLARFDTLGNLKDYRQLTSTGSCCFAPSLGFLRLSSIDSGFISGHRNFSISSSASIMRKTKSDFSNDYGENFGTDYYLSNTRIGSDSSLIMVGRSNTSIYGRIYKRFEVNNDFAFLKTYRYPNSNNTSFIDVVENDSGYLVMGYYKFNTDYYTLLMQYSLTGDTLSKTSFFTPYPHSNIEKALDGGYFLFGNLWDSNNHADFRITKLDSALNITADIKYGDTTHNLFHNVEPTPDGYFILSGTNGPHGVYTKSPYLIKIDSTWCTKPTADFTYNTNIYTVNFSGVPSSVSLDSFSVLWDFGDGNTSTALHPENTYAADGTYYVCLTVTDVCGTSTFCKTIVIDCHNPAVDFNYSSNLYTASFLENTNTIDTIKTRVWDFGDGNTSTDKDPVHQYATNGIFNVCLTETDTCGTGIKCKLIEIICPVPITDFIDSSNIYTAFFTNNSISGDTVSSWIWNFGDGNTSTDKDPVHIYDTTGIYNVCLTQTDICGSDSICKTIEIKCLKPVADFTSSSNLLTSIFSSNSYSVDTIFSPFWDFGDGNTSTDKNPVHTYAASGTYNICKVITDICGTDTICKPIQITCPAPIADFSATSNLYTASFSNKSVSADTVSTWIWDFGDGNTSTSKNPLHSYTATGTYNVCLTINDICGSNTYCSTIQITCPKPSANFYESSNLKSAIFTDNSSSSSTISSWLWDFGDGDSSALPNPSHIYAAAGTYNVCLSVTDICGTNTFCQPINIVCPAPVAKFNYYADLLKVTFNDSSSGKFIKSWFWDFGDNNTSTIKNPIHTYNTNGSYNVCLTITDTCFTNIICETILIAPSGLEEGIKSSITIFPNPTNGNISINYEYFNSDMTIEVFDITGRKVQEAKFASASTALTLPESPGIYTIIIKDKEGNSFREKIVKIN